MRMPIFLAPALCCGLSAPLLAGEPLTPLQLFGIEGRYELTPRGDLLLFPNSDVSELRDAPTVFAGPPGRFGSEARRLHALPDAPTMAPTGGPYGADPIPGPFRAQRFQFAPAPPLGPGYQGYPPGWRPPGHGPGW